MSTVVSAKIPKKLKEQATKYGIEISKTVRNALEEKVKEMEKRDLEKHMDDLHSALGHLKKTDIVKTVRQSRDER